METIEQSPSHTGKTQQLLVVVVIWRGVNQTGRGLFFLKFSVFDYYLTVIFLYLLKNNMVIISILRFY